MARPRRRSRKRAPAHQQAPFSFFRDAVATAAQAVLVWVKGGTEACMNRFNGPADDEKKAKKGKRNADDADKNADQRQG